MRNMKAELQPRRFSIDEFHRMIAAGIFDEDDRLELLQGEIIKMTPIGPRRAGCVTRLTTVLGKTIGDCALLSVQNPVQVDDETELYPDVALLKPRADGYRDRLPRPEDILLLIEVADASLKTDQSVKIPQYARGGVVEVWLFDLDHKQVYAHTNPVSSGYQTVRQMNAGELQASQLPVRIHLDEII